MSEFNGKTDKPRLMTSIGYARVSTGEQDTALQLDALRKAGCERLFEDKASGVKTDRPGLAEAIRYVRDGDTLTVWKPKASASDPSPKTSTPRHPAVAWYSTCSARWHSSSAI